MDLENNQSNNMKNLIWLGIIMAFCFICFFQSCANRKKKNNVDEIITSKQENVTSATEDESTPVNDSLILGEFVSVGNGYSYIKLSIDGEIKEYKLADVDVKLCDRLKSLSPNDSNSFLLDILNEQYNNTLYVSFNDKKEVYIWDDNRVNINNKEDIESHLLNYMFVCCGVAENTNSNSIYSEYYDEAIEYRDILLNSLTGDIDTNGFMFKLYSMISNL